MEGYINGAKMGRKYKGVSIVISKKNELDIFIPCATHYLNITRVHTA